MTPRLPALKPARPETVALAAFVATLIDLAAAGLLLLAFVDHYAPPQDLPWKPLSLDHPLGMATGAKINRIADDPAACRAVLAEGGVRFSEVAPRTDGFCSTVNAVRLEGGTTPLAPAGPTMTCPEALAVSLWDRQVLQPAARTVLKSRIVAIDHYGTYSCRRIYGRTTGRVSEHASANAFDFAGVRLADGRRITVARHFRAKDARGDFMRQIRDGACRVFRATLSPDYNAAHHDHLHLDSGRFQLCR